MDSFPLTVNCWFQFFLVAILILTQEFTHSQYKEEPSCSSNKTSEKKPNQTKTKKPQEEII